MPGVIFTITSIYASEKIKTKLHFKSENLQKTRTVSLIIKVLYWLL